MLRAPLNMAEFFLYPSREQWEAALDDGWAGPDGSSMSTDTIFGVRVGRTDPSYDYADLGGNRHDWYYYLGRRFRFSPVYRHRADVAYRQICIAACRVGLKGWKKPLFPLAVARCWARYGALRAAGKAAFTAKARAREAAWSGLVEE